MIFSTLKAFLKTLAHDQVMEGFGDTWWDDADWYKIESTNRADHIASWRIWLTSMQHVYSTHDTQIT